MPQDSPRLPEETCQAARIADLVRAENVGRPIADAVVAIIAAAAPIQADAEMVGAMLQEIRGGWLWALLTKPKQGT